MPLKDPEAQRAYSRQYYAANREATLERKKKYREANREKLAEQQKKYYAANREATLERSRKYVARKWREDPAQMMRKGLRDRRRSALTRMEARNGKVPAQG